MNAADRVHALAASFLRVIHHHYGEGEAPGKEKALEVLNALANTTACILAGANSDEAQEFFNDCLEQSIEQMLADIKKKNTGLD